MPRRLKKTSSMYVRWITSSFFFQVSYQPVAASNIGEGKGRREGRREGDEGGIVRTCCVIEGDGMVTL